MSLRLLSVFLLSAAAHAGGFVGNGGYVVRCNPSRLNDLNGIYSLDFVLSAYNVSHAREFERDFIGQGPLLNILHRLNPARARDYQQFLADSVKWGVFDDRITQNINYPAPPADMTYLPPNCPFVQKGHLAVWRLPHDSGFDFITRPELLKELKAASALQYSYLMTHEFLWTLIENDVRLGVINRLLHDPSTPQLSLNDLKLLLPELAK